MRGNLSSHLYRDYLLDEAIFGEALYRALLVDAIDPTAVRIEHRTIRVEVVAEDSFRNDFFVRAVAADQLPRFRHQGWSAVFGAVGGFVGVKHVAPDHHLANVSMLLAGVTGCRQRVSGIAHGEEIEELKDGPKKTYREQHQIEREAPWAGCLIRIAIRAADVIERAVICKLRSQQIELGVFGESRDRIRFEIKLVNRERRLRDGESGLIASDGGRLEDEFLRGAGTPVRSGRSCLLG